MVHMNSSQVTHQTETHYLSILFFLFFCLPFPSFFTSYSALVLFLFFFLHPFFPSPLLPSLLPLSLLPCVPSLFFFICFYFFFLNFSTIFLFLSLFFFNFIISFFAFFQSLCYNYNIFTDNYLGMKEIIEKIDDKMRIQPFFPYSFLLSFL